MIVSFHPHVPAEVDLRLGTCTCSAPETIRLLRQARGVIVPQSCKAEHYWIFKQYCPNVFPNYDWRYGFEGKCGNARLFGRFGAPHPSSRCFRTLAQFRARVGLMDLGQLFAGPVVIKPDRAGGGYLVRLIKGRDDLTRVFQELNREEQKGESGFIVQQYYPTESRDLRVVVIGNRLFSYWRCQKEPGEFRTNLGCGGCIVLEGWPEQQRSGCRAVRGFCQETGLNLAAFDLIFPADGKVPGPLFLEINFCFGRRGIGGTPLFREFLLHAVESWRKTI
ncbi:MAG: RimK family alpha-L-glutamate ligase [Syntrophobacteria bacterium]